MIGSCSPPLTGRLRASPTDFQVDEVLGFAPAGRGEHALLQVEKAGANTAWVAQGLARHARVAPMAVGYAGLKDRHALTTQWFSVHLAARDVDWSALRLPGVRVLQAHRHDRKLRRGAHQGNRFCLRITGVQGDLDAAMAILTHAASAGVPNAFGSQRFGRAGGNVGLISRWAGGARMDRTQRGFALSTARALIFNAVLQARVAAGTWDQLQIGDFAQLEGRGSHFGPLTEVDAALVERCRMLEIHPTGPLWGRGCTPATHAVAELEARCAAEHADALRLLEAEEVRQERRALRMRVQDLRWDWQAGAGVLELRFGLGRGSYATTVLDQILVHDPQDPTAGDSATCDPD